jgi:hypothetical protein
VRRDGVVLCEWMKVGRASFSVILETILGLEELD